MPEDLPIYPDAVLRTRSQFADVDRLRGIDTRAVWEKSDGFIALMEGGSNIRNARLALSDSTKQNLLKAHSTMFDGRLRRNKIAAIYRGQDCPEPQFIHRSLDNFFDWMQAGSVGEIYPIEKAALVLTRIVDIWPFDAGNVTTAIVFANFFLKQAGFGPFFVLPEHMKEFNMVVAQAMSIETQPLVSVMHKTIKREMEALGPR